jgi:hypothetical protein
MKQLYEVGEVVLLRSKGKPHLNGEYTVRSVVKYGEQYTCRLTGYTLRNVPATGDPFCYILEEIITDVNLDGMIYENSWKQSALRKRQQPSNLSFNQLINVLNSPITSPNKVQ